MSTRSLSKPTVRKPVSAVRRGYKGSGYEFRFMLCRDASALRQAAMAVPYRKDEPWFHTPGTDGIPVAYTSVVAEKTLPGVIEEALPDGFVVRAHIMVAATDDETANVRHWFHEIGHAVAFCAGWYPEVFARGVLASTGRRNLTDPDIAFLEEQKPEFYGYATEFLALALADAVSGCPGKAGVSSGFPFLFPWLGEGVSK